MLMSGIVSKLVPHVEGPSQPIAQRRAQLLVSHTFGQQTKLCTRQRDSVLGRVMLIRQPKFWRLIELQVKPVRV